MIWQPEFTDKTLSRKPGAVHIARQANSEIKKARQQFPDKNVDDICRSVLKKHRETVTLMGFTPTHLSLAIGMLNGVFKER
ncbi:cell division protein ZapA [Escherichia coli]|uniref:cell division protein ZapA n=1 Tax=Escherichia coli TaxID=562 RepID=UPI00259D1F74|nr:cell division protein ZapA [Escherichia coli]MDM4974628.1 cell division protein ZapA [Escherichia coli]MDM5170286.1 cell division protein ZapA [Escherichia coli]